MFQRSLPPMIKNLLIVNVLMFFITSSSPTIENMFSLGHTLGYHKFQFHQFITYQYVHAGLWHLFFNMLLLFFFGPVLEEMWGSKRFISVYTIAGIFSGILHMLFNYSPVVGASGSLYAIFTAFALYFPDQEVHIYGIFPVKVKWIFFFYLLTTLMSILSSNNSGDNIAHWAHFGGIVIGYIYVKYIFKSTSTYGSGFRKNTNFSDSMSSTFKNIKNKMQGSTRNPNMKYSSYNDQVDSNKLRHYRKVVDELLDKINTVGYLQLSDEERRRLEEASDYLKKFDSH